LFNINVMVADAAQWVAGKLYIARASDEIKRGRRSTGCGPRTSAPFPLEPDTRYEWRIVIDDEVESGWTLPFQTTPDVGLMAA
jgi:hypothetical protein